MEALNQNHANQMIETLSTLNENIISLRESLKLVGMGGVKEDKDKYEPKQTDEEKESTKGSMEHLDNQKQESMVVETQRDLEAVKTMQELEGQIDQ